MSAKRLIGIVLLAFGIVALVWGGVFWTDRDTVVDAGPLEIATEETEGFPLSPVFGVVSIVAGVVLLIVPDRRRV